MRKNGGSIFRSALRKGSICLSFLFLLGVAQAAGPKWQAQIPPQAKKPELWISLLDELSQRQLLFGTMATASRMLVFFTDLPTKQAAYQAIIGLTDRSYPFPVQDHFLPGDIIPAGDYDFINSYLLYKSILNQERGTKRWAEHYLQQVDQVNFPKFLFYQAIQHYSDGRLDLAEESLRRILEKNLGLEKAGFIRKVVRTLARIYFDRKEYAKSSELYQKFLLKTDPVTPSDWLEAAWNLYYLKKYSEALGMLYNLESRSVGRFVHLEKYTLRAMIYRALCMLPAAESLISTFDSRFGKIISAVKKGEQISRFPELIRLNIPENQEFKQISLTLSGLRSESRALSSLPDELRSLAMHIYRTEVGMLTRKRKGYVDEAFERAAKKLVMTGEHLKFLRFDVQREKFSPDRVFRNLADSEKEDALITNKIDGSFEIRWPQYGDYWRDERLKYRAMVVDACAFD